MGTPDTATITTLALIHTLTAEKMLDILKNGEEVVTKNAEGEAVVTRVKPSAAMFGAILKFLKDNNIEADPTRNKPLVNLAAALPFTADGEENPEFVAVKSHQGASH